MAHEIPGFSRAQQIHENRHDSRWDHFVLCARCGAEVAVESRRPLSAGELLSYTCRECRDEQR